MLFSTNTYLKFLVHEKYGRGLHFAWCSPQFDSRVLSQYVTGSLTPPSSNPADIYQNLHQDVKKRDRHSNKIADQRARLLSLAAKWQEDGSISSEQGEEMAVLVDSAEPELFKPILYVIPFAPIAGRVKLVPLLERASPADEYTISDLRTSEFEIVEFKC